MPEFEFPPGVPEEVQEFMVRRLTRQEMEADAFRHDIVRFFHELNKDQLHTLYHIIAQSSDIEGRGEYFQGYIVALQEAKFNICSGCGVNHDEALREPVEHQDDQPGDLATPPQEKRPGWDNGDRVASCSSCHGDTYIKVCNHPPGTHGQFGREMCPEPLLVPCPECRTPEWFTDDTLPMHPGRCQGTLLPIPSENIFVCAECGNEVKVSGRDDTD